MVTDKRGNSQMGTGYCGNSQMARDCRGNVRMVMERRDKSRHEFHVPKTER